MVDNDHYSTHPYRSVFQKHITFTRTGSKNLNFGTDDEGRNVFNVLLHQLFPAWPGVDKFCLTWPAKNVGARAALALPQIPLHPSHRGSFVYILAIRRPSIRRKELLSPLRPAKTAAAPPKKPLYGWICPSCPGPHFPTID